MAQIYLSCGAVVLFDDDDAGLVGEYGWRLGPYGHAEAEVSGGRRVAMHRLIMRPEDGLVVHHKDRNKLNNERSNLCLMTQSEHAKEHWQELHDGAVSPKPSGPRRVGVLLAYDLLCDMQALAKRNDRTLRNEIVWAVKQYVEASRRGE